MVSIHRILIVLYMTIRVLCFVFRFKREAHSSLASRFKASWKLPTNVETSNFELHADMNKLHHVYAYYPWHGYTIGL